MKPGLFPVAAGKGFHREPFIRQTADDAVLPVPHDDAAEAVREAESFVEATAALIANRDPPPTEPSS